MNNYLIKALNINSAVDSVILEVMHSRADAIAKAKSYSKMYYNDTIIVEEYKDKNFDDVKVIGSFKHTKLKKRKI